MLIAAVITASVNSSRDPVRAICHSIQGSTRRPAISIRAMKAETCSKVWPIVIQIENHRSDIVWKRMRGEPNITRGLKLAGFTGGWLNDA